MSDSPAEAAPPPGFHAGYAAILGRPNVGKSTLLNRLLDHKLSIVSAAPQTTRQRVVGILSRPSYQIIFLDTPGMIEPRYELQRRMVEQAMAAIGDADLIIALVEARDPLRDREVDLLRDLLPRAGGRPLLVVLNKIDRTEKSQLLPMIARIAELGEFTAIIPLSALHGDGVERLEAELASRLPEHPPFYPPDMLSDRPERFFAAELVREKLFHRYREEVPYATAVRIAEFADEPGRAKVYIKAEILVERETQKAILIGEGGRALKRVGSEARAEIETLLGRPVFLELEVRVVKEWRKNERILRDLGL